MFGFQDMKWLALALLISAGACQAAADGATVLEVAPAANHLDLLSNPNPNYLSSPAIARYLDKVEKMQTLSKRSSHKKHHHKHHKDHKHKHHTKQHRKHSSCQTKVCKERVNTIYSGVYPVVNMAFVAPNGTKQTFVTNIDTSTSDTWVVTDDFVCTDVNEDKVYPQSECKFGKLYKDDGGFKNITDLEFSVLYEPANFGLAGDVGYHTLELAGIQVKKAEVVLVNSAGNWQGDGHTSSTLGMGYPSITAARYIANSTLANYDPVFFQMFKEKLVKPIFSFAFDRVPEHTKTTAKAGVMALGGLVPEHLFKRPFTSAPIEEITGSKTLQTFVISHEFVYGKTSNKSDLTTTGKFQSIVDPGTASNYMPTDNVDELNALFDPPAVYNSTLGAHTVDCDAKAPYAAFIINGITMPVNRKDMILRNALTSEGYEGVCLSSFSRGGDSSENPMVIGQTWHRSYVVAYDIGNSKLHFAHRRPY